MENSRFMYTIKIKDDVYALYNSLLFDPVFVNEDEKEKIIKEDYNFFSNYELNLLFNKGIIVKDRLVDEKALSYLKEYVLNETKEKISLVYIIGNNKCNLACKYCFIGKMENEREDIEETTIANLIEKFYIHIKKKNIGKGILVFYGAEPLLNFSIIKFTSSYIRAKKYNIDISLVTNATLLDEEKAIFIKNNNIGIGISIDGPKHLNDANRVFLDGSKGTYDIVMTKIKMLQRLRVPFGLSTTINDYALNNKKEYFNWIISTNVKEINYNLMHFNSNNDEWKKYYEKVALFLMESRKILSKYGISEGRLQRKYDSFYKN